MSATPTLHSRLRVLVAKAFRAEKLYSTVNTSRAERLTNLAALAEAASEVRSREWQRSHYQLRTALNDVLSLGSSSAIVREVVGLRDGFARKSQESLSLVEKGAEELIETARRHEFAHIFKISVELIRLKAQAQASRVIADELSAVLEACNASTTTKLSEPGRQLLAAGVRSLQSARPQAPTPEANSFRRDSFEDDQTQAPRSNVIQLKRRAGSGLRKL